MIHAVLTVSLDERVCPNVTTERRYEIVRAALRLCFPGGVVGQTQSVTSVVHEPCGVFSVECDGTRAAFDDAVHHIAQSLGQDCIEVVYADGTSRCIGPSQQPQKPAAPTTEEQCVQVDLTWLHHRQSDPYGERQAWQAAQREADIHRMQRGDRL